MKIITAIAAVLMISGDFVPTPASASTTQESDQVRVYVDWETEGLLHPFPRRNLIMRTFFPQVLSLSTYLVEVRTLLKRL